jgi:CheY-like chemotaxis protein
MRLIIVEDEVLIADVIGEMAADLGHEIVGVAHKAAPALALAQREMPDLALIDMHLPGRVSGAEVARILRALYGIPAIFVSGNPGDCRNAAKATGAIGCLTKPFVDSDLAAALQIADALLNGKKPGRPPATLEVYTYIY